jgi:hypothetical protein
MQLQLKNGIEQLLFGMKQKDVMAIYGKPSRQFEDEDANIIYLYNKEKLRLTFYADEEFKLGYIISSNFDLEILNQKVMGLNCEDVKIKLPFKNWEVEYFDSTTNHFNESNWLILQSEFDVIIRVELGAIINEKDEVDWKFKS